MVYKLAVLAHNNPEIAKYAP